MNCPNPTCGATVSASARFCDQCTTPVGDGPRQTLYAPESIGPNIQAGRDAIYMPPSEPPKPVARYTAKWSWQSPVTLAWLTWLSVALGLLGVIAGWQGLQLPIFTGNAGMLNRAPSIGWLVFLVVVLAGVGVTIGLRHIVKHRTQQLSPVSWLPAITGWGGRLGLARFEGTCPIDGGRLRFYNKAVEWRINQNGSREVTKRQMTAECIRDPEHRWSVGRTDSPC